MPLHLEEVLAAKYHGYTWEQYQALPGAEWWAFGGDCKSEVLARYRMLTAYEQRLEALRNGTT